MSSAHIFLKSHKLHVNHFFLVSTPLRDSLFLFCFFKWGGGDNNWPVGQLTHEQQVHTGRSLAPCIWLKP